MFIWIQIYLLGRIQICETGGQLYSDEVSEYSITFLGLLTMDEKPENTGKVEFVLVLKLQ